MNQTWRHERIGSTLPEDVNFYGGIRNCIYSGYEISRLSPKFELPGILIRGRIARGLSQGQLAEKLRMKEQQIQRYESEGYGSARLRRLTKIAEALGLNIREVAEFRRETA